MKTFQIYPEQIEKRQEKISMCLGYFDGVHIGHKEVIEKAVQESDYPVSLLTFDKPVSSFLENGKSCRILTSLNDRFRLIDRLGVDYYFVLHIDSSFLSKSVEDFIKILKTLNVVQIFVGSDYHFGKNRSGGLKELEKEFEVVSVPFKTVNNVKVSTQSIISEIKEGNIKFANELLGHNYLVNGTIVKGHQNGTKFGIKTANIKLDDNYVLPKYGVYKVISYINGVPYLSLANVGTHPTIDEEKEPLIEVHIPRIQNDLYGQSIYIEFIDFIRPEIKFESVDELIKQIKADLTLLDK